MANRRLISDFSNGPTLGISLMVAFTVVAPRYGVRLEGIEDDANEWSDFWQQVAREAIDANSTPADVPSDA